MVRSNSPTIALIKNSTSLTSARALISLAICEVCDFFNVGKNMNDKQVALTADLIIESFWHLKLEEIKYCFRRAMRTEKLFDRLDGNIILGWLAEYDRERTEEAMRISDEESRRTDAMALPEADTMSLGEYVADLQEKAEQGDETAKEGLAVAERFINSRLTASSTRETRAEHEDGFRRFRNGYVAARLKGISR